MMKRTILGVLMLVVGLVTASSPEGLALGVPLVSVGFYVACPRGLVGRLPSPSTLSPR